jgi:uncharacterized protein YhfF
MNAVEQAFWAQFKARTGIKAPVFGSSWSFGTTVEMADRLGQLVLDGKKTGTTSAVVFYAIDDEPFPTENEVYDILLNGADEPIAILQTKKVTPFRFNEVTEEMARLEGEGDLSVAYWQAAHRQFFQTEFAKEKLAYDEDKLDLLYQEFEVVYS